MSTPLPAPAPGLLQNRNFLLLWVGQGVSVLGDFFGNAALSLLVYELTGSKVAMGSLWLAFLLPMLPIRLLAGPLLDRLPRRPLLIAADMVRAAAFIAPVALFLLGRLQIWHLFATAAASGVAMGFFQPVVMAFVPSLVPREQFTRANAAIEGARAAMSLLGPAVGAAVVAGAGPLTALAVNSVAVAASALLLLFMRLPAGRPGPARGASFVRELAAGYRFFGRHPELLWLAGTVAFLNLGSSAVMAQLLPYVVERLGSDVVGMGLIQSSFAAGLLLGTAACGALGEMQQRRLFTMGALVVAGVLIAALALVDRLYMAMLLHGLAGVAVPFFNINSQAIYQVLVPDALRGRVFALRLVLAQGSLPLGAFLGGVVAESWGLTPMLLAAGLLPAALAVRAYFHPTLRQIDGNLQPGPVPADL